MFEKYNRRFTSKGEALQSGGLFNFDAVSDDGSIVANISTSGTRTGTGKNAAGNIHKVRSDIFFLLLAKADRKLMLLTEKEMYERWLKECENGRVPDSIEFVHVKIPQELNARLRASKKSASREVTPIAMQAS